MTEQIVKQYEKVVEQNRNLQQELQTVRQECEELKEKYKWYEHYKESALYNTDLCNKKSDELARYKQALEKIEKEVKWVVDNRECFELRDADRSERILNIINEVKDNGK